MQENAARAVMPDSVGPLLMFFFSSRRRHTRLQGDWSSDVCSSDLGMITPPPWQRWDWHPSVLIGLALLGGLYVYLGGLAAPRRRVTAFGASLVVLGVALNGPLHNLSDGYLFSAHMVQHLALTLVFPPLLLYRTPA